jgi:hypothetical protein
MSRDHRLRRLEQRTGEGGGRVTFRVVVPPPGLTAAEHSRWNEEQRRESEARGEYIFGRPGRSGAQCGHR